MSTLSKLISVRNIADRKNYSVKFFRFQTDGERDELTHLLTSDPCILVCDEMYDQLKELVKIQNPSKQLSAKEIKDLIENHLDGTPMEDYGVWVYYPWLRKVVHLLDEEEFIEVRTSRNKYKITDEEREVLRSKTVGVIGLSVGQSAAVTMALERTFGEIRIADYDQLELTNLNRIRSGTHNLGLPKVTMVAREIAEIDPFLKVVCYFDGITENNIEQFFNEGGKLDLLVEECDGVDIKILAREVAKKHRVPVVMDTSDSGCLDIERYDLERDYPLLHGLISEEVDFKLLQSLETNEDKMPYLLPMVQVDNVSSRMKGSLLEVGQTISTWPQLSSDVSMGGAYATNLTRRILLDQLHVSGRFYVDPDDLIKDEVKEEQTASDQKELSEAEMSGLVEKLKQLEIPGNELDKKTSEAIISKALGAPSVGNMQPWKWFESEGNYFLFRDKMISDSFSDAKGIGTLISHGTTLETLKIEAEHRGTKAHIQWFPLGEDSELTAAVTFSEENEKPSKKNEFYHSLLDVRCTQRENPKRVLIEKEKLNSLVSEVNGSEHTQLHIIDTPELVDAVGALVRKGDRIRLMNPYGHKDFFGKEVRWGREHSEETRDGLDMSLFDMSPSDQIGMEVLKNWDGVEFLRRIEGGSILERVSKKSFEAASAIGVLSIPDYRQKFLIDAGISLQRMWLKATDEKIAVQPMTVLQMLFPFVNQPNDFLTKEEVEELSSIKREFHKLVDIPEGRKDIFLFRMFLAENTKPRSFRKPIDQILTRRKDVQV